MITEMKVSDRKLSLAPGSRLLEVHKPRLLGDVLCQEYFAAFGPCARMRAIHLITNRSHQHIGYLHQITVFRVNSLNIAHRFMKIRVFAVYAVIQNGTQCGQLVT